ncbi:hypothetical protein EAF04_001031 [Stromatinia cepivora]|nr:hypothetical protein EAF04_001031 [Stromatinia cepivora]
MGWGHARASLTKWDDGQGSSNYPSANARRNQRNWHAQYLTMG